MLASLSVVGSHTEEETVDEATKRTPAESSGSLLQGIMLERKATVPEVRAMEGRAAILTRSVLK